MNVSNTDETISYSAQIVANGESLHVVVPKMIRNFINLERGDLVQVQINLIKKARRNNDDNDTTRRTHNLEHVTDIDMREKNGSGGKI